MIARNSDRVKDLFVASARELTPVPVHPAVRVLYAPVSCDPEVTKICGTVLSDDELQRADRFAVKAEQDLFKQRRAFRRFCGASAIDSSQPLSEIIFRQTENERPYISARPDLWFSFSSCRFGFLGAWSPIHGIGIDIEDQTTNIEILEFARGFFSRTEADVIENAKNQERPETFLKIWNLKEAALKSIGQGLPFGLDAFEFELEPCLRVRCAPAEFGGADNFGAHLINGTGCCAALVVRHTT